MKSHQQTSKQPDTGENTTSLAAAVKTNIRVVLGHWMCSQNQWKETAECVLNIMSFVVYLKPAQLMVNQPEFCPPGRTHFTCTMRPETVHTGGKTAKSGNSVINCSCLPRPLPPLRTCMWTLPSPTSPGRGPEGGVHSRSGNTPPVFTLGSSRSPSSRTSSSSSSSSSLRFSFSFLESGPTIQ